MNLLYETDKMLKLMDHKVCVDFLFNIMQVE